MAITRKTFVEFLYNGDYEGNRAKEQEVPSRNLHLVDVPSGAYGFRFFDVDEVDGEPRATDVSGAVYAGGELIHLEEVAEKLPQPRYALALENQMREVGWDTLVRDSNGTIRPFYPGDLVLELLSQSS